MSVVLPGVPVAPVPSVVGAGDPRGRARVARGIELGLRLRLCGVVLLLRLLLAIGLRVAAQRFAGFVGHLAVAVGFGDRDVVVSFGAVVDRAFVRGHGVGLLLRHVLVGLLLGLGHVLTHLAGRFLPVATGGSEGQPQDRGGDQRCLDLHHVCTPCGSRRRSAPESVRSLAAARRNFQTIDAKADGSILRSVRLSSGRVGAGAGTSAGN